MDLGRDMPHHRNCQVSQIQLKYIKILFFLSITLGYALLSSHFNPFTGFCHLCAIFSNFLECSSGQCWHEKTYNPNLSKLHWIPAVWYQNMNAFIGHFQVKAIVQWLLLPFVSGLEYQTTLYVSDCFLASGRSSQVGVNLTSQKAWWYEVTPGIWISNQKILSLANWLP